MKFSLIIALLISAFLLGFVLVPINVSEENEVINYIGNFHPLVLHLPIGALLGVFLLEVINLINPKLQLETASKLMLWFTTISLLPTIVFGVFLASSGGYNAEVLSTHKWLGFATALACTWLLVFRAWAYAKNSNSIKLYKVLLFSTVGILTAAGHYGGSLTHGANYLTKDMPNGLKDFFGVEKTQAESILDSIRDNVKASDIPNELNYALVFADSIHPIMDKNCFSCHNATKLKGDLQLDVVGWEMKSPENIVTWKKVYNEIGERNMPPEEEAPLTEEDRKSILSWISSSLGKVTPAMKQKVAEAEAIEKEELAEKKAQELATLTRINKSYGSKGGAEYHKKIKPILDMYCFSCHGPDKQKGGVRLDILNWDMVKGPDAESWHSALDMINLGEMPPKKKPQLSSEELELLVDWMTASLSKAAASKQEDIAGVMRRLTKKQYTNTLRELFNLPLNFGEVLPDDGKSKMGFSNNGSVLQVSSLHIDYYQKIAREALDDAIIFGDKPESISYKVDIAQGIGEGKPGAEFGGYQTIAIDNNDFDINISNSKENAAALEAIKAKIGLGMRGSANDRFGVVKEGLLLNSALPHQEVAPRSWQGPSPNLKLIILDHFPRKGDFVFRVEASKGYVHKGTERLIGLRNKVPAIKSNEAIVINARDFTDLENLELKDDKWLLSTSVVSPVKANFTYNVEKEGFYQIDLVHPYAPDDAMPSLRLKLFGKERIQERIYMEEELASLDSIITPLRLVFLKEGIHNGVVDKDFFIGLSQIIITPIPENDPVLTDLNEEVVRNEAKYSFDKPSIQAFAGSRTDDGMDYGIFDVSKVVTADFGDTQVLEFKGRLENLPIPAAGGSVSGDLANMIVFGLWNSFLVKSVSDTGPPLLVKSVELETPYFPEWPPKSHTDIFFDSPIKEDSEAYTREVIASFMRRAFRRPVDETEVNRYINFWQSIKGDYDRYEDSVKEVLVAVLCSPSFLYIIEPDSEKKKTPEQDYFLAANLSYFLWDSPPDSKLVNLASQGALLNDLPSQIDRMVNSPKIWRMIRSFTYDWLRIDRQESMNTNMRVYKDYTRFVKKDMAEETYQFIHEVLTDDLSIMNFIDSDFAMLNQNLAEFYGVKGVKGNEFRPVTLSRSLNRGGLLSQGAFLNGHSDGEQAHPIKRAVWLKEKILGDPAPPPPPNVPELDPDTPGFDQMTLKEQLELHRNKPSCMGCHNKIDPYGVVFENYDAVGRFNTIAKGRPIDVKSVLPDGTKVEGIQGIKEYILYLKTEAFTKSLVEHLFAYALGRNITFADEAEINNIVENVKANNFRFQSIIEEIVLSPSFAKTIQKNS